MDKVYVIYFDGKMYENRGRKTVYLKEGSAKQVITSESKELAKDMYDKRAKFKVTEEDDFYLLDENIKNRWLELAKSRFKVITFVPMEDK